MVLLVLSLKTLTCLNSKEKTRKIKIKNKKFIMTHYRLKDSAPSAVVLSRNPMSNSLDECRIYNDNSIFLNDNDEFVIKLFNPTRNKIGAKIGINGNVSDKLLVLNPGESVSLERFLDTNRRMIFNTYSYDASNPTAVNAVAENGIIKIDFFNEQINYPTTISITNGTGGYGTFTSLYNTSGMGACDSTTILRGKQMSDSTLTSACLFSSTITPEQEIASKGLHVNSVQPDSLPNIQETGRVEKGNLSNQNLTQVNVDFLSYPFYTVIFKLKPKSAQTQENYEIRDYCTGCGYRVRNSNWKYCPKCGNNLKNN